MEISTVRWEPLFPASLIPYTTSFRICDHMLNVMLMCIGMIFSRAANIWRQKYNMKRCFLTPYSPAYPDWCYLHKPIWLLQIKHLFKMKSDWNWLCSCTLKFTRTPRKAACYNMCYLKAMQYRKSDCQEFFSSATWIGYTSWTYSHCDYSLRGKCTGVLIRAPNTLPFFIF